MKRKKRHLDVCFSKESAVRCKELNYFDQIHLVHHALPQLREQDIDIRTKFWNYSVSMPVFISSMTGGFRLAKKINRELAQVAQECRVPLALGSHKVAFTHPQQHRASFDVKKYAPGVPVLSNLGATALKSLKLTEVNRFNEDMGIDAQIIHLNCGQELMQSGGDTDFRGLQEVILEFGNLSSIPVVVKETGAGFHPKELLKLWEGGISCVDIAGAGGTNWLSVEALAEQNPSRAQTFLSWGHPSVLLLLAWHRYYRQLSPLKTQQLWASGGVRGAQDIMKAMALGAHAVGMAWPIIGLWRAGGPKILIRFFQQLKKDLLALMLLTQSCSWDDLQKTNNFWLEPSLESRFNQYSLGLRLG